MLYYQNFSLIYSVLQWHTLQFEQWSVSTTKGTIQFADQHPNFSLIHPVLQCNGIFLIVTKGVTNFSPIFFYKKKNSLGQQHTIFPKIFSLVPILQFPGGTVGTFSGVVGLACKICYKFAVSFAPTEKVLLSNIVIIHFTVKAFAVLSLKHKIRALLHSLILQMTENSNYSVQFNMHTRGQN